jgi:CheY-like chemotaxis protein
MLNRAIWADTFPILIVENDADLCILLRYLVAQTYPQASIVLASTGQAALQILTQHGAGLVVIDHQLPAHLPIVLLASDNTVQQTALACGVTEFVAKPFAIEQLVQSLVSALPHARAWPDGLVWPC